MGSKRLSWFWRYMNYLATWREHRRIVKELNELTDAQLRDMGLYRGDIDRLVWLEEDKKRRGKKE
jgi:uncharacterized protein YjiS (DUF1127 family)